jgi:hypothetical protein
MTYDLTELQHKLMEAQGETNPYTKKIRMRTAAMEDAAKLLQSGLFTPQEISYFQNVPLRLVLAKQKRLERIDQEKQRFLRTARIEDPHSGGYVAIFKR